MIVDAREIQTKRLRLRPFREEDYDDLYEFLSQLKDDEFEGYPGITYENGRKHLQDRLDSTAYYAVERFPIRECTCLAITVSGRDYT